MESVKRSTNKRKILIVIMGIIIGIIAVIGIGLQLFFNHNLNYDEALLKRVYKAGFVEKDYKISDNEVIHYAEGPDNGPPLIMIHGQGMTWSDYSKVLPELSKSFKVYSLDCFGHGESTHDRGLYSAKKNGEAIISFIDNLIKEPVYLTGHSSGGIIAAWIASEAPDKIKGLLLEDPPFFSVTPEEAQEGKGAFVYYESYKVAHDYVENKPSTDYPLYAMENSYFISLLDELRQPIIDTAREYRAANPKGPIKISWLPAKWFRASIYLDKFDPEFGDTFYTGEWMEGIDQKEMLKKIKSKTIYLKASTMYGEDGVLYAANTEEDADKVMTLLQNAERIDIESGHSIHFEKPKEFAEILESLLEAK